MNSKLFTTPVIIIIIIIIIIINLWLNERWNLRLTMPIPFRSFSCTVAQLLYRCQVTFASI